MQEPADLLDEECPKDEDAKSGEAARSYYYDDAHGYEIYKPEEEEDEETRAEERSET